MKVCVREGLLGIIQKKIDGSDLKIIPNESDI